MKYLDNFKILLNIDCLYLKKPAVWNYYLIIKLNSHQLFKLINFSDWLIVGHVFYPFLFPHRIARAEGGSSRRSADVTRSRDRRPTAASRTLDGRLRRRDALRRWRGRRARRDAAGGRVKVGRDGPSAPPTDLLIPTPPPPTPPPPPNCEMCSPATRGRRPRGLLSAHGYGPRNVPFYPLSI